MLLKPGPTSKPAKKRMEISNEVIGILAGILTSTSMIPQLVKIIKEKNAENVSHFMIIILILGTGLWAYYGVLKKDMPIIITNVFSCTVNAITLFCKFRFTNNK
jgi:MtN3 and saliva related transmembrane protein